jgi:chromosomal replication initiation ATPase DnaA
VKPGSAFRDWLVLPSNTWLVPTPTQPTLVPQIVALVAASFGTTSQAIMSERRARIEVIPRHVVMWLIREATPWSLQRIGHALDRDHSAVLSGIRKIDRLRLTDGKLHTLTDALLLRVTAIVAGVQRPPTQDAG